MRKCIVCGTKFEKISMAHTCCSTKCAIKAVKDKTKPKLAAKKTEKTKTLAKWKKEAQDVFNAYIRLRDAELPCVSCGTTETKFPFHAGHYLSVGGYPELRFCEDNVHKQCMRCNTWLHGNLIQYRKSLVVRLGVDRVEWLESHHEPKKYAIHDMRALIAAYRRKITEVITE